MFKEQILSILGLWVNRWNPKVSKNSVQQPMRFFMLRNTAEWAVLTVTWHG
jgi:hypothetical protein